MPNCIVCRFPHFNSNDSADGKACECAVCGTYNITGTAVVTFNNKEVDPRFFRPTNPNHTEGDPSKAERTLGWRRQHSFRDLVRSMVDHDLRLMTDGIVDDSDLLRVFAD